MRKNINILCAAAAMLALASCAKESLIDPSSRAVENPVTFTVDFDGTKTAIGSDLKTTWSKGDRITVYDSKGNSEVVTVPDEAEGQSSATITTKTLAADTLYYAVLGGTEYDSGDYLVKLPEETDGGWAKAQIAVAQSKSGKNTFKFKNVAAVLSFELEGSDVSEVSFGSSDPEFGSAAYFSFDAKGYAVLADEAVSSASELTVKTAGGAGKYYLATLPNPENDTLSSMTISLKYASQTKVITIDGMVGLKKGHIINLGKIEGRAGKTYNRFARTGFTESTSDKIDASGNIVYTTDKGGAITEPGVYSNNIRLYQPTSATGFGGYIDIKSTNGDPITGVKITTATYSTKVVMVDVSEAFDLSKADSVAKGSGYGKSGFNSQTVRIYNCGGTANTYRLNIASIEVTCLKDTRTQQLMSFPKASYEATIGTAFTAPTVSGAKTSPVVYSSSDEAVAKVDASTGAVTLVAAGKCIITATAPASETYKEGQATYELTVANPVEGIAGIKSLATGTEVSFSATLTGAVVTALGTVSGSKEGGYIEDATGGIYIFLSSASGLAVGDKIDGNITGKASLYNGVKEITALTYSSEDVTHNADLPLTTLTVADLIAGYSNYEFRRVKIESATVTDPMVSGSDQSGAVKQGETTYALYATKKDITLEKDANVDFICFPSYYNTTKQGIIWNQSDITVNSGKGVITVAASKSVEAGKTVALEATINSGAKISYSSNDETVATVDADGIVTGLKAGTAVITLSAPAAGIYSAAEASCTVTVTAAGAKSYTIQFGPDYNSDKVNNYTSSWTATKDGFTVSLTNWNNNNKTWNYIRCGQKNTAGTAVIATANCIAEAIKSVTITIDAITADAYSSIKLYVSKNSDFTDAEEKNLSIKSGEQVLSITTPTANCYYKFTFDYLSTYTKNGSCQVSKIVFSE